MRAEALVSPSLLDWPARRLPAARTGGAEGPDVPRPDRRGPAGRRGGPDGPLRGARGPLRGRLRARAGPRADRRRRHRRRPPGHELHSVRGFRRRGDPPLPRHPAGRSRHAGAPHDRLDQPGDGRHPRPRRRQRLLRQAVGRREARHLGEEPPADPGAPAGEREAEDRPRALPRRDLLALRPCRHRLRERRDAPRRVARRPGRGRGRAGLDHRGERRGQGEDRRDHPGQLQAPFQAVRPRQRGSAARRADGERALRRGSGGVHRARAGSASAASKPRTAARSSWTRSERSLPRGRSACCASSRRASTSGWARASRAAPTSASSRRPTPTWAGRSPKAASARTSTSASTSSRSPLRRCATVPTMSCRSPAPPSTRSPPNREPSLAACRRTRRRRFSRTPGRATSASSSTGSSERPSSSSGEALTAADLALSRVSSAVP